MSHSLHPSLPWVPSAAESTLPQLPLIRSLADEQWEGGCFKGPAAVASGAVPERVRRAQIPAAR
jgi:hypothetical protein